MNWIKKIRGLKDYHISFINNIYEVLDKNYKVIFTAKTLKTCKKHLELLKNV